MPKMVIWSHLQLSIVSLFWKALSIMTRPFYFVFFWISKVWLINLTYAPIIYLYLSNILASIFTEALVILLFIFWIWMVSFTSLTKSTYKPGVDSKPYCCSIFSSVTALTNSHSTCTLSVLKIVSHTFQMFLSSFWTPLLFNTFLSC